MKETMHWFTSLKRVLNIIDLHLRSWHTEYTLLLQTWKKHNSELTDLRVMLATIISKTTANFCESPLETHNTEQEM